MADDLSAPLPQLDLAPDSILTVDVGAAGAVITSLTVYVWQETGEPLPPTLPPLLAHDPNARLAGDLPG